MPQLDVSPLGNQMPFEAPLPRGGIVPDRLLLVRWGRLWDRARRAEHTTDEWLAGRRGGDNA